MVLTAIVSIIAYTQNAKAQGAPGETQPNQENAALKQVIYQQILNTQKIELRSEKSNGKYETQNGIYKAFVKDNVDKQFPFGFEFDGKTFEMEPVVFVWDTGTSVEKESDLTRNATPHGLQLQSVFCEHPPGNFAGYRYPKPTLERNRRIGLR